MWVRTANFETDDFTGEGVPNKEEEGDRMELGGKVFQFIIMFVLPPFQYAWIYYELVIWVISGEFAFYLFPVSSAQ